MKKKEKEDSTPPKPRIRRKAEKLLEDSEELYHLLADHMKDLVWLLDLNLNIKYISPSVEKLTGYNLNEIQNITLEKLLSKTSFDKAMKFFSAEMTKALAAPDDYVLKRSLELELSCRDGRMIWTENAFSFIRDENRKPVSILCEGRDINDRRRAEKALRESEARHRRSEERYRNILDNMEEAYYEVDLKGDLTFFNATAVTNLGYSNDEMMGMNFRKYVDKENEQKVFEAFHRVFVTGEPSKGVDWELISKNGEKKPIESSISLMKDVDGNPVGFRGIIRDITERKRTEEQIRLLAIVDTLTGLFNRRGFITLAEQQLKTAYRTEKKQLLFFIDLDGLKVINDTYGHDEGDHALQKTAMILKQTFRESDIIGRLGGDEFAVLVVDDDELQKNILKRLKERIKEESTVSDVSYKISMSIGVAEYDPSRPCKVEELMLEADRLMYIQKKEKKQAGGYHI
ncbi:MAG: PAS domain S-box protein [Smithella sp.]|nr:PAS domain S-box protein [Smithella sp.]